MIRLFPIHFPVALEIESYLLKNVDPHEVVANKKPYVPAYACWEVWEVSWEELIETSLINCKYIHRNRMCSGWDWISHWCSFALTTVPSFQADQAKTGSCTSDFVLKIDRRHSLCESVCLIWCQCFCWEVEWVCTGSAAEAKFENTRSFEVRLDSSDV